MSLKRLLKTLKKTNALRVKTTNERGVDIYIEYEIVVDIQSDEQPEDIIKKITKVTLANASVQKHGGGKIPGDTDTPGCIIKVGTGTNDVPSIPCPKF